jgi:uncharacterized lipoprotein YajG
MKKLLVLCAGLLFAGCATTSETPVAVDTYCLTARKIPWSVEDTAETVRKIEIHNRTIDIRCSSKA